MLKRNCLYTGREKEYSNTYVVGLGQTDSIKKIYLDHPLYIFLSIYLPIYLSIYLGAGGFVSNLLGNNVEKIDDNTENFPGNYVIFFKNVSFSTLHSTKHC